MPGRPMRTGHARTVGGDEGTEPPTGETNPGVPVAYPDYASEMGSWSIFPVDYILPPGYKSGAHEDMFKTDRAYWKSFRCKREP